LRNSRPKPVIGVAPASFFASASTTQSNAAQISAGDQVRIASS
jgi:hypothetical protein